MLLFIVSLFSFYLLKMSFYRSILPRHAFTVAAAEVSVYNVYKKMSPCEP